MSVALKLYEQLSDATDDQARFQLIAHAIGQLEETWPRASEVATAHDVREAELRLQKEIESVRKEIEVIRGENKDMELRLQKEIKQVELNLRKELEALRGELGKGVEVIRGENKEMELRLQKEIKQVELQVQEVRVEVQETRVEIKATEASLRTAIHRQTLWMVGAVGAVVGFIRVLEWLFP
jgi:chromosome segregation ATPase